MTPPTWFDWTTVAAIVLGPVLALGTQRGLDRIREKRNRRFQIYLTLMSLRSTPLHPDHVKALNALDTVFGGRGQKDNKIRTTWDKVLAHVATERGADVPAQAAWDNKFIDLRVDLYQAVGRAVGYDHRSTRELDAEHVQSGLFLVAHVSNQHSQRRKNFLDRRGGLDKCSLNCGRGPRFGVVNAYSPWFPLLP